MASDSHYKAVPVGVDETLTIIYTKLGRFIASTAGTITITIIEGEGRTPLTLPGIPVVAGADVEIPIFVGTAGRSTLVASGGASGILLVS